MKPAIKDNLTERQRMLEGTARTLSGNFDLEVVFSQEGECSTNAEVMWLPDTYILEEDIILSLMAHELGHLKYSDFGQINKIKKLPYTPEENHVIFHITNVLEDLRIEKLISDAYPGFGSLFLVGNRRVQVELERKWGQIPALNRVLIAMYFLMSRHDCDFIETGYFVAAAWLIRGHEYFIDTCDTTADVAEIALDIFARLREGMPKDLNDFLKQLRDNQSIIELLKDKAAKRSHAKCPACGYPVGFEEVRCPKCGIDIKWEEKNGGDEGDGVGAPDKISVAAKPFFDDTVTRVNAVRHNSGNKRPEEYRPSGISGRSILDATLSAMTSAASEAMDFNPVNTRIVSCSDIVKTVVRETVRREKNAARVARKKTYYTAHPVLREQKKRRGTEFEVPAGPGAVYEQIARTVSKDIKFLQRRLADILAWDSVSRWRENCESGRKLDRSRLWRIPSGERRLFSKKQDESKKLSIAFTLLVDESGSMEGDKTTEARRAAVLFCEALQPFNIPFEVIGYTTKEYSQSQLEWLRKNPSYAAKSYNAVLPLRHDMFKRFGESYPRVKSRLVRMNAFEGNEDAESLHFAWERLKKRKEKNRVLILVFDSEVVGGMEARNELARLVKEINATPGAGCFGIGIRASFTGEFFDRFVNIDRADQLGENVVRLIESCVANAFLGAEPGARFARGKAR